MTEEQLQLLTIAVDGELSPSEQWAVHRLLVESVEARTLLARLQSDSIRLRNVPKTPPPADLATRIMARLPGPEPARPRSIVSSERRQIRQLSLLAASLLAILGGGVYFLYLQPAKQGASDLDVAQNDPSNIAFLLPTEEDPTPPEDSPPAKPPVSRNPPPKAVIAHEPPVAVKSPEPSPPPHVKGSPPKDVLTAPPLAPIAPLARAVVRVPLLLSLSELEQDDAKQRLAEELALEPAYRIDLFATDPARGAELFQSAARARGITLHTDAGAANRIKRNQAAAYLAYLECLTPAEVRDLLAALAEADAKNAAKNAAHVFDMLHAAPAVHADQVALKEVLGIDPGLWKRPAPRREAKPISARTGDEIAAALGAPKTGDKHAVLLSFTPAAVRTSPGMSKELKEFLARRGERKASAVPVLIAIRHRLGG